jgi:hypothetical protein
LALEWRGRGRSKVGIWSNATCLSSPSSRLATSVGLEKEVLDLLAQGAVLTRANLRDSLAVKNERLGEVLESLQRAGRLRRTPAGWQRRESVHDEMAANGAVRS